MTQVHTIDRAGTKVEISTSRSHQPSRVTLAVLFAALGALSFWLPDVVIHFDAGPNLDSPHAWAITLAAPAMFLFAYVLARRSASTRGFTKLGPAMLLGVWLSGGLFMTVAAMVAGSEFIGGTGVWRLVVIFISVIPIVTFILAASDGSLFALLAITMGGLLIVGFRSSVALWSSNGPASDRRRPVSKGNESKAA